MLGGGGRGGGGPGEGEGGRGGGRQYKNDFCANLFYMIILRQNIF